MCAVSSQPGVFSSAYVCPWPVSAAPNAASARRIAAIARFCLSIAMRQARLASVHASSDAASSRPMEKGPSERIMYTMASVCATIAPSATAQARLPQRRLADTPKHHPSTGGIERETRKRR
jgi:hypothetical protein